MNTSFAESVGAHHADKALRLAAAGRTASSLASSPVFKRLLEAGWWNATLIATCVLVGTAAGSVPALLTPASEAAAAAPHVVPTSDALALPTPRNMGLRLDLDPDAAGSGARRAMESPPAADRAVPASADRAPRAPHPTPGAVLAGMLAGLLAGLMAAGLRERVAQPLRTSRQVQQALGAPVLGAIPTLSPQARKALLDPPGWSRGAR